MKVDSVFVTGANRGIGLEFVRQFSLLEDAPRFIFATYRNPDTIQALKDIQDSSSKSRVILIKMDVNEKEDMDIAKQIVEENVGDKGLTMLINNAGMALPVAFPDLTAENLEVHFKTNAVGPILLLQTLYPLLETAASTSNSSEMSASRAMVLNISSLAGSITNTGKEFTIDLVVPGYKISKAAFNMGMRVIAANVKDKGVLIVNMCPGWVKTDMGGKDQGMITVEESIGTILKTLGELNDTHHGSFMDRSANLYAF
jgi:NAD(P)-dependent dehydrogenase (short-subunit alcohol dehydrogenase family)